MVLKVSHTLLVNLQLVSRVFRDVVREMLVCFNLGLDVFVVLVVPCLHMFFNVQTFEFCQKFSLFFLITLGLE